MELKISDPRNLDPFAFLRQIAACFKYATLVELDRSQLEPCLIEDIDQIAQRVLNNPDLPESEQGPFAQRMSSLHYHWSTAVSGGRANSTFLVFATRFRLDSYVKWKLKQRQSKDTLDSASVAPAELSSMLHAAVVDVDNLPNFEPYTLPNQGRRSMELIELLLRGGANPYEKLHGESGQEWVESEYNHISPAERKRLLELFRRHGRKVSRKFGRDASAPVIGRSAQEVYESWSFKDELVMRSTPRNYAASICEGRSRH